MNPPTSPLEPGDLVQGNPDAYRWGPVVIVVQEVRPWGVKGYFITHDNAGGVCHAYVRVLHGEYQRVGRAEWWDRE